MRHNLLGLLVAASLGCGPPREAGPPPARADTDLAAAERLIDAFYSFDPARLRQELRWAGESAPRILYYQGWAKGGHYQVRRRQPCVADPARTVRCAITVEDDLIKALQLPLHVTDTFRLAVSAGAVRSVRTSSDDPPLFEEALSWVRRERAEQFQEACAGFFAGGPTPEACVRVVVAGFAEYVASQRPSR